MWTETWDHDCPIKDKLKKKHQAQLPTNIILNDVIDKKMVGKNNNQNNEDQIWYKNNMAAQFVFWSVVGVKIEVREEKKRIKRKKEKNGLS